MMLMCRGSAEDLLAGGVTQWEPGKWRSHLEIGSLSKTQGSLSGRAQEPQTALLIPEERPR